MQVLRLPADLTVGYDECTLLDSLENSDTDVPE
jgi:hypothetical protein